MNITDYVNNGEIDQENLKVEMRELDKSDSIYHAFKGRYSHDTRLKAYVIKWLNDLGVFRDTRFYEFCRHSWEIPYCGKKNITTICKELKEYCPWYDTIDDKYIEKMLKSLNLMEDYHVNKEFFEISEIFDQYILSPLYRDFRGNLCYIIYIKEVNMLAIEKPKQPKVIKYVWWDGYNKEEVEKVFPTIQFSKFSGNEEDPSCVRIIQSKSCVRDIEAGVYLCCEVGGRDADIFTLSKKRFEQEYNNLPIQD